MTMIFLRKTILKFLPALMLGFGFTCQVNAETIVLASNGFAGYSIVSSEIGSSTEKFANQELKKYLDQLSSSDFLFSDNLTDHSIVAGTVNSLQKIAPELNIHPLEEEEYGILKRGQNLYLAGGSDAAVLFVVYDFLADLGCRWIAPDFDFYEGQSMSIPVNKELKFNYSTDIFRKPALKYRKLYIEEGKSHNTENLKKLIDWMPKARFNILVAPLDYQGGGKVKWDNWRDQLTPELEKRGITIEVGGHGYQNFLNADMENGKLYKTNPEWFGLDKNGIRPADPHIVFCTSNPEAVAYLQGKLLAYLKYHPEIDIFDFWPPDSETWCECPDCLALGSASDRHALLVSQTARFLHKELPKVKLECLAYSRYVEPPKHEIFDNNILLDFCPINQSFEYPIYSDNSENNKAYKESLLSWFKIFDGDISIYSYYRKYAWRSLPVVIPHYMQNDLRFYRDCGAKGISVYSEPGDWYTYGLNHFILANLAWNPDADVDRLIAEYCTKLYGPAAELAIEIYNELEKVVRFGCKIPYTRLKDARQYNEYIASLETCLKKVETVANQNIADEVLFRHLHRLELMLQYATESATLMKFTAEENKVEADHAANNIKKLMSENATMGVFIVR